MNPDEHHNALNQHDMLHWYEIRSILGQGGFGITYLARDTNLNHDVAIKEYLPTEYSIRNTQSAVQPISEEHAAIFEWGKARFLDEARTLFKFKHPNIVRVLSFFEFNNTGYMVMEYEEGSDFSDMIGPGKSLDQGRLLDIIVPILDGLELIHENGFIHRDIKPSNIFIRTDGSPVLIDFGSARRAMGDRTRTMTSMVTPGYSPLEQYHEEVGKQGPWTDIYALGATLYAAITGQPPADALQRSMARAEHKSDAYLPLADLMTEKYSPHFLKAIDSSLEFVVKNRPQKVTDWSKMLRGVTPVPDASPVTNLYMGPAIKDELELARKGSSSQKSDPAAGENKRASILPVLLVLAAAAGAAALLRWEHVSPYLDRWLDTRIFSAPPAETEEPEAEARLSEDEAEQVLPAEAAENEPAETPARREPGPEPTAAPEPEPAALPEPEPPGPVEQKSSAPEPPAQIEQEIPKPEPRSIVYHLTAAYASELSITRNPFSVNPEWYFGEPPGFRVRVEQTGNAILGYMEGNREGRIEGTVSGNEINFQFYIVDPSDRSYPGSGIWFISDDSNRLIGKWSLVNPSDGSTLLEGDWRLTKLE